MEVSDVCQEKIFTLSFNVEKAVRTLNKQCYSYLVLYIATEKSEWDCMVLQF